MKRVLLLQLIFAITVPVPEVNGTIVIGPGTNMSVVMFNAWLMGSGKKKNRLPPTHHNDNWRWREPGSDAAVGRRFLKNVLAALRSTFFGSSKDITKETLQNTDMKNNVIDTFYIGKPKLNSHGKDPVNDKTIDNESTKFISNDFTDYEEDPDINKDLTSHKDKTILRTAAQIAAHREQRKQKEKAKNDARESVFRIRQEQARVATLQSQHDERVKEISDFIKSNKIGAHYIHSEVRRIKRDGVAKDTLRRIVEYLEVPGNEKLKNSVLRCFYNRRKIHISQQGFWKGRVPNNLVIDVLKDPFNDNVNS